MRRDHFYRKGCKVFQLYHAAAWEGETGAAISYRPIQPVIPTAGPGQNPGCLGSNPGEPVAATRWWRCYHVSSLRARPDRSHPTPPRMIWSRHGRAGPYPRVHQFPGRHPFRRWMFRIVHTDLDRPDPSAERPARRPEERAERRAPRACAGVGEKNLPWGRYQPLKELLADQRCGPPPLDSGCMSYKEAAAVCRSAFAPS